MKRSKFTDEQILAIVREGEAGRKVPTWFALTARRANTCQELPSRESHPGLLDSGQSVELTEDPCGHGTNAGQTWD